MSYMILSLEDLGCVLLLHSLADGGAQALTMVSVSIGSILPEERLQRKCHHHFPKAKGVDCGVHYGVLCILPRFCPCCVSMTSASQSLWATVHVAQVRGGREELLLSQGQ
ncbi:hypothetical protein H1C71_010299 [Ictidomys tridecemlineatus]|nr:hypothetical protein H1C71_010299 [Ictidomys tridecemlineatus]